MWRSKKFILTVVLSVVVLGAILGGYAVANADDEDTGSQPPAPEMNLLGKVAEIYEANTGVAIDPDELQNAFNQARNKLGIQARERMQERLVEEGVISEEQLDEFEKWLEARPDFSTEEFKAWMEARPDMPMPFGPSNEDGGKRFGGMFRGFVDRFGDGPHGWCAPDTTEG